MSPLPTYKRTLTFGGLLISLLFIAGMTYIARFPDQQITQGQWVSHTREVLNQLDKLALHLTEAESGQRGYLLVGQEDYLTTYNTALGQIDSDLDNLQQATSDNDLQQSRILTLRQTIKLKLDELEKTIDLRKNQSLDAALKIVLTGRGKTEMLAIYQQINSMKEEEESLLRTRLNIWQHTAGLSRIAALAGGGIMYVLICTVFLVLLLLAQQRKKIALAERRTADAERAETKRLAQIVDIQHDIAGHMLDLENAMQTITGRIQALTHAEGSIVEILEANEMVYRAASGTASQHIGLRLPAEGSLSGLCIKENTVLKCDDSEIDERVDRAACRKVGLRSMVVVPLRHKGKPRGVLKVLSSQIGVFDLEDVAILELMAGLLSATLSDALSADALRASNKELEMLNSTLEKLATTDGLTGLKNHRTFQETLFSEFERAQRYKKPLSLVMLDVDHFKNFNDTFGHPAGDAVLKRVSMILQDEARGTDQVARYGGEEFALLLPETDAKGAHILAERILHAIAGDAWQQRPITVSIGINSLEDNFESAASMLQGADQALYLSKKNGRNKLTHYQAPH